MAVETERKFLVKGNFKNLAISHYNISQFYLSIDPEKTIRLRLTDDKAFLTIKGRSIGNSISRSEWEYLIPLVDAKEMVRLCLPGKIIKTRYIVPSGVAHVRSRCIS